MSGVTISMELSGDGNRLLKKLKNMSEIRRADITEEIAEQLRTSTIARFRTATDPEGKRWKQSIRARDTGGITLTHTAQLRNSIRAESDQNGLAVGTNVAYGAAHQFGDRRTIQPRKAKVLRFKTGNRWVSAKSVTVNIPARPFLGISDEDEAEIRRILDGTMKE